MNSTGNSSMARGTSAAGTSMPRSAEARTRRSADRLGAAHARISAPRCPRPCCAGCRAARCASDSCRHCASASPSPARAQQAGDDEERGRGEIARHLRSLSARGARGGCTRAREPLARHAARRSSQHALAVIAAHRGRDHGGRRLRHTARPAGPPTSPARSPPACGSRCRAGGAPPSISTGGVPLAGAHVGAHLAQRLRDPLHRPLHQRLIADQRRVETPAPHSSPVNRRIAVPALPMSSACGGALQAVQPRRRGRAPRWRSAARCARRGRASPRGSRGSPRSPEIRVTRWCPRRAREIISARCEIDLSPGTRAARRARPRVDRLRRR